MYRYSFVQKLYTLRFPCVNNFSHKRPTLYAEEWGQFSRFAIQTIFIKVTLLWVSVFFYLADSYFHMMIFLYTKENMMIWNSHSLYYGKITKQKHIEIGVVVRGGLLVQCLQQQQPAANKHTLAEMMATRCSTYML